MNQTKKRNVFEKRIFNNNFMNIWKRCVCIKRVTARKEKKNKTKYGVPSDLYNFYIYVIFSSINCNCVTDAIMVKSSRYS